MTAALRPLTESALSSPVLTTLAFVIPARNESAVLADCLTSIQNLRVPTDLRITNTIVVDNSSTDGTAAIAAELGATVITVEPRSAAHSRNQGANHSTSDWIAFVDADCVLPDDWLEIHRTEILDGNTVAVGSAMASPPDVAPWVEKTWFNLAHGRSSAIRAKASWLPTFNLLVAREAFEAVDGFDESLETCEDVDLSYRIARYGDLIRSDAARVRHLGESRTLSEFFRREAWRTKGTWVSLKRRGIGRGELPSLLVPCAAVLAVILSLLGLVTWSLVETRFSSALLIAALILGMFGLLMPALHVHRKGSSATRRSFVDFSRAYVLSAVFLTARTVGLLSTFRRVDRT